MKKLLSIVAGALCIAMASCATEMDKECSKIAEAMKAGNMEEVATLTEAAYAKADQCQARNLADLSIAYNLLANAATDNTTRYDYAKKVVDCYKKAVAADEAVAKKCYETAQLDMAGIAAQYEAMFPDFEAAIAQEQAAAQAAEEGEAVETEETEEVVEE